MGMRSGLVEGLPYSLSRWTDVPAAKWSWMKDALKAGRMVAFDPRNAIPSEWSLRPEDTLGLVFWTKDPTNIILEKHLFEEYSLKVHVTVTGWGEVERGAPDIRKGADMLALAADQLGPENVSWRFSPVPNVPDVVERFEQILGIAAYYGVRSVYLSFLQTNDLMAESRSDAERLNVLNQIAKVGDTKGVRVLLCNEDRLLARRSNLHRNLSSGVCAPPEDFALPNRNLPLSEGCGCVLMVDPFTVNETCTMGCSYCYAADQTLSPKKRNTTRSLTVLQ